jgi:DNA polymerase
MVVGEQPGDMEDQLGRPFVGPAGKVFDEAMQRAGLDRNQTYLTNAVKHFKFILRGKKRIHNKPSIQEAIACRPWLVAELELVKPDVLVCLGATAAQSLIGTDFRITRQRGEFVATKSCEATIATYHPSAVLRAPDPINRERIWTDLVTDLRRARTRLSELV